MQVITLPSIRVGPAPNKLVTARRVAEGEIAHFTIELDPETKVHGVVPAQIARQWEEVGLPEAPRTLEIGLIRTTTRDAIGPLASVAVRYGAKETRSFLVLPELARKWVAAARRFEKLYEDYQSMTKGAR